MKSSTRRFLEFRVGSQRARDLVGLGQSVGNMTQGLVDAQDIYRAAIVQSVSALDYYMHGVVLDLAVDIVAGRRQSGSADRKFGLPLPAVQAIMSADPFELPGVIAVHLSQRLSMETMQRPDDIAKALAMVGVPKIWSTAFPVDAKTVTTALGVVVSRRNRIVHQSDADPLAAGVPTPISALDAIDAIATIENVVEGIDLFCL